MIFGYAILLTALLLSLTAAYYSVAGLTAIFAAATIPVIIMGSTLELGKIVGTVWLHNNWRRVPLLFKLYLIPAIIFLMALTSLGTFGYLSKAHLDQAVTTGDASAKVQLYDDKIQTEKSNIEASRSALKQMDATVNLTMERSTDAGSVQVAANMRKKQAKERADLLAGIEKSQKEITALQEAKAPLAVQARKIEAEVGPIKYIAAMIYGDNPDTNLLERAVRWVIIMIVLVFDPLALCLILAANKQIDWALHGKGGFLHDDEPKVEPKVKQEEFKTPPTMPQVPPYIATPTSTITTWTTTTEEKPKRRKFRRPEPKPEPEVKVEPMIEPIPKQAVMQTDSVESLIEEAPVTEIAIDPNKASFDSEFNEWLTDPTKPTTYFKKSSEVIPEPEEIKAPLVFDDAHNSELDELDYINSHYPAVSEIAEPEEVAVEHIELPASTPLPHLNTLPQELAEHPINNESEYVDDLLDENEIESLILTQAPELLPEELPSEVPQAEEVEEIIAEAIHDPAPEPGIEEPITDSKPQMVEMLVEHIDPNTRIKSYRSEWVPVQQDMPSFAAVADGTANVNVKTDFGTTFPTDANKGDMYLRVDYLPAKLHKYNGIKWMEVDKTLTDSFAFNEEYVKYLIEKLNSGEYTIEDVTEAEQDQIAEYLSKS